MEASKLNFSSPVPASSHHDFCQLLHTVSNALWVRGIINALFPPVCCVVSIPNDYFCYCFMGTNDLVTNNNLNHPDL